MEVIAILTLVMATIGTVLTLLFKLHGEKTTKRDTLLRWVDQALSLNGAWKWKGRMVATEYELDRVIKEGDSASSLARRLHLGTFEEEISSVVSDLEKLKAHEGWDEPLGNNIIDRLFSMKKSLLNTNLWWPFW